MDIFWSLWKRIPKNQKACFFCGLLSGILTHIYVITNKIPNWDDLSSIPTTGLGPYGGRWLGDRVQHFFSQWSAPGINGVWTVILLVLAANVCVLVLEIRTVTGACLVSLCFVTFPATASNMTYMFMAPTYSFAILAAALSCWFIKKYKWGILPGTALLVISMATYQAYFPFAACLLVLSLLLDVLDGRGTAKQVIFRGFYYVVCLAAGMGAYLLSVKLSGYPMASYRGMDNLGNLGASAYVLALLRGVHRVLQYFVTSPESYGVGAVHTFHMIMALVLVLVWVLVLIQRKLWKRISSLILFLFLTALVPVSMGLVYVMAPEVDHASLNMVFSYVMLYVFLICLAERLDASVPGRVLGAAAVISLGFVCYANYRIDNTAYYRSYIANERVGSLYERVYARIEQQDGYAQGDAIIIAGTADEKMLRSYDLDGRLYGDFSGLALEGGLLNENSRVLYLRLYLGVDVPVQESDEIRAVKETKEYQSMPVWPADGCIRRISDTWVVKLTEG